jgi:hypothetical protein
MALTEPLDILSDFPGWVTDFDPQFRQDRSRVAGGRTYLKDLGPSLWRMAARSKDLRPNGLDHWRARLQAMQNGMITFRGYSLSRTYPILYPRGSWPTGLAFNGVSAELHTVDANRKAVRVGALPAGFVLSVGDMIQIGDADLHRVMEAATADGSGLTGLFEVQPHIWTGVDGGGSPPPAVSVKKPSCIMAIVPGSISTAADLGGRGSVSFQAIEAR